MKTILPLTAWTYESCSTGLPFYLAASPAFRFQYTVGSPPGCQKNLIATEALVKALSLMSAAGSLFVRAFQT